MRATRARDALALAISGLLPLLMSPPIGWIFLQPFAWAPALGVFSKLAGRHAFFAGWGVGTLANLAVFYWIVETISRFSNLPAPAAVLILLIVAASFGAYVGVFALGVARVKQAAGSWWPFAVAAWFTACEFLNPQLFPYLQGVGWFEHPRVFLLSTLTGISGISFLLLLVNGVVLQLAGSERGHALRNAAITLGLIAASLAYTSHRLAVIERREADVEPLRIALVQSGLERQRRSELLAEDPDAVLRGLLEQSAQALQADPEIDVFVWPEGELSHAPRHPRSRSLRSFAHRHGVEIWTGGRHHSRDDAGRRQRYNSAFRILRSGEVGRRYDKNVLLPFGEFVPFEERIPILKKLRGPGRMEAGDEIVIYEDAPARFAFTICYEAILSFHVRRAVREDVDLLVNVTYDGWFGRSSEPYQHLMLAVAQAAQHGVPLVRSTTTGISAVLDARGAFLARSRSFEREVITADLRPLRVPAPYTRLGDCFAWACVLASLGLMLRPRRHAAAPPEAPPSQ